MAKELPYFKFYVSEWSDGDITLESPQSQALFINLCAYYWSNKCSITVDKCQKKYRSFGKKAFTNLLQSGVIKNIDGNLEISFLDKQMEERAKLSDQNRKNVKKRYEKSTGVTNSYYENATIKKRREEKREEEKRTHNTRALKFPLETYVDSEELHDVSKKISDYFDSNIEANHTNKKMIYDFVRYHELNGKLDWLKAEIRAYHFYKIEKEEKLHSLKGFIGSREESYSDGGLMQRDWQSAYKKINRKSNQWTDEQIKAYNEKHEGYA